MSEINGSATKIHVADRPPVACAACFGQYPDRVHVDMGSSFDGPVLNIAESIEIGVPQQQIDELVLCDECLRAAAALLGLVEPDTVKRQLEESAARCEELSERLAGAVKLIDLKEREAQARESLLEQLTPPAPSKPARQPRRKAT